MDIHSTRWPPSPLRPITSHFHLTHTNKYSLQEISTLPEIASSMVFSHLNTPESSILLGNMYMYYLVKPLYWNKRKQPLKRAPLNKVKSLENTCEKVHVHVHIYFSKILHNLKVTGTTIFKIKLFFLIKYLTFLK